MNERIKLLAEQAEDDVIADHRGDEFHKAYTQRFAELIVRECIDKVDKAGFVFNEQPQYNDKQNALVSEGFFWALESAKQQILEHFGVEE